jgi:hypothetical protein
LSSTFGELLHLGAEMMPSWSRSHWMSDPVTAIEPSSA